MSIQRPLPISFSIAALTLGLSSETFATSLRDYLPTNVEWNGYSEFAAMVSAHGSQLEQHQTLHPDALDTKSDRIMIVYPTAAIDPQPIVQFVQRGGLAVVADDYGRSRPLLHLLNVARAEAAPSGVKILDGIRELPFAHSVGTDPLVSGVQGVAANHASFYTSPHAAALVFDQHAKEQLLLSGKLGSGRYILLADPSVLINSMLAHGDNRTFADNLAQTLAYGGRRTLLFVGDFEMNSSAAPERPVHANPPLFSQLGRINDFALTRTAMHALAFAFAGMLLLALLLVLPFRSAAPHRPWRRSLQRGTRTHALVAAKALRDLIEEALCSQLNISGPISSIEPSWIVSEVTRHRGPVAADLARRLLNLLRWLPERDQLTDRHPGLVSQIKLRLLLPRASRLFAAFERADARTDSGAHLSARRT